MKIFIVLTFDCGQVLPWDNSIPELNTERIMVFLEEKHATIFAQIWQERKYSTALIIERNI